MNRFIEFVIRSLFIGYVYSLQRVSVSDVGAALLAIVVVPPEGLNAEGNEAQTEDPAAKQAYDEAQQPLQSGFLYFHPGLTLFTAVVALHLSGPHVPSWLAVWSGQAWWSGGVRILHGW